MLLEGSCIWAALTKKINTSATHKHTHISMDICTHILHPRSMVASRCLFECPQTRTHIHTQTLSNINKHQKQGKLAHPSLPAYSAPSSYSCISRLWTSLPSQFPFLPTPYPTLNGISRPQKKKKKQHSADATTPSSFPSFHSYSHFNHTLMFMECTAE